MIRELFDFLLESPRTMFAHEVGRPDARENYSTPEELTEIRPFDPETATRNLLDFIQVAEDHHLDCWPFFGTLLGIIRDGELIAHDTDVDIAIFHPGRSQLAKCVPDLERRGFQFLRTAMDDRLVTFCRDSIILDVYVLQRLLIPAGWVYLLETFEMVPAKYLHDFTKIEFRGRKMTIPASYESLFGRWYGFEWRIPQDRNFPVPDPGRLNMFWFRCLRYAKKKFGWHPQWKPQHCNPGE